MFVYLFWERFFEMMCGFVDVFAVVERVVAYVVVFGGVEIGVWGGDDVCFVEDFCEDFLWVVVFERNLYVRCIGIIVYFVVYFFLRAFEDGGVFFVKRNYIIYGG